MADDAYLTVLFQHFIIETRGQNIDCMSRVSVEGGGEYYGMNK